MGRTPTYEELQQRLCELERAELEREQAWERASRINQALLTVRGVNQLIVREKDRSLLLRGVCDTLVEMRAYHSAWIARIDEAGRVAAAEGAARGKGDGLSELLGRVRSGELPPCARRALAGPGVEVGLNPPRSCNGCPLSEGYGERADLTVRLQHHEAVYGVLTVSVPADLSEDGEEQDLIREVAGDVALALHDIEAEEERRRTTESLKEATMSLQAAVEAGKVGLWDWDLLTDRVRYSREWKRMIGFEEHEIGDGIDEWQARVHPEDLEATLDRVRSTVGEGLPGFETEFRFREKDGGYRWILAQASLIKDQEGRAVRLLGSHVDITDRKRAEEALRALAESEIRPGESPFPFLVRKLAESAGCRYALIAKVDPEDPDTAHAQAVWDGEGHPENFSYSLQGTPCRNVLEQKPCFYPRHIQRLFPEDRLLVDMAAESYWGTPLRDEQGRIRGILAILDDRPMESSPQILELLKSFAVRATAELKHQEHGAERRRLMMAIEQAAEVIVITDSEGTVQYVNPAFERVTGYKEEEILGKNPRILKSGRQDHAFYETLWQTIEGGRTWQGRFVNRRKDGSLYTEEASISPVMDEQGKITNFVAVKRDITTEMALEKRLMQAQKMEAIGTLAGGIAHDFNNILSAMMGFTGMVEADLPEGSRHKEDLGEVMAACHRARDLVRQILAFSRRSDQKPRPLRLDLIVKEALKMLRSSLPASIEIRSSFAPDLPAVTADPTQAHQVLMNLCTNAAQAMEDEHGVIEVTLDEVRLEEEPASRAGGLLPGRYVRLRVRDSGTGMPPHMLERIFEPYFTTKRAGEGTGLGLAVVYGIVKECGGDVSVESESGRGSTFSVHFPATEWKGPETSERSRTDLPRGRERILFVDDEASIAKLGEQYLKRLGYRVTTKQSSVEALDLFRADPGRFDLVITDMTMPQVTGDELAREMLAIRPETRIVLCTGYSKRISDRKAGEIGIRAFLMKPLTQHDLAYTVREVLDGERD